MVTMACAGVAGGGWSGGCGPHLPAGLVLALSILTVAELQFYSFGVEAAEGWRSAGSSPRQGQFLLVCCGRKAPWVLAPAPQEPP